MLALEFDVMAKKSIRFLDKESLSLLDAYVAGINDYIST
jgi:acyl-homoserine lactone acylase PvdQ